MSGSCDFQTWRIRELHRFTMTSVCAVFVLPFLWDFPCLMALSILPPLMEKFSCSWGFAYQGPSFIEELRVSCGCAPMPCSAPGLLSGISVKWVESWNGLGWEGAFSSPVWLQTHHFPVKSVWFFNSTSIKMWKKEYSSMLLNAVLTVTEGQGSRGREIKSGIIQSFCSIVGKTF